MRAKVGAKVKSQGSQGFGCVVRSSGNVNIVGEIPADSLTLVNLMPSRESVHQETADELSCREGQDLALLFVGIILVAKTHSAISQLDQSPVRDGHAVRVAGQILQNTSR